MSFPGSRGSRSWGAGRGGSPRARRSPDDRPGEELQETIRGLISDDQDADVQEALAQAYHTIQDDQRPSTGLVIDQIAQLVDLGAGNISPREAILRMAGSRFDYQAAVTTYLDEPMEGGSPILSSPSGKERERESAEVEGLEEEDGHVSDHDMEEESESSTAEESSTAAVLRRTRMANRGIDRTVAKRGEEDLSKLTITIRGLDGRPDKVHRYRKPVDFSKPVKALNRWRAQVFRRNLGGSRPFRQHFHEQEKDWLLHEHIDFERNRLAQGKSVDYSAMRWDEIVQRFNRRFEGQYLPGVRTPRPSRTKAALRAERSRVKKITDYTGIPFNGQVRGVSKRGGKRPAEEVESEDESGEEEKEGEEDEDEKQDPRGTRRGDLPPGKKPWRKEGDDEDGSGGGLSQPILVSEVGI
ncbi:hypothetical protein MMC07_004764 [Pseudocyphellaria aurata]|nr:hypothetical protein [Pseudocyphellaria aurata]